MAVDVRVRDKDSLAQFLGWFSIGLGIAQLTAPRVVSRLIGADPNGRAPTLLRLRGASELTQGVGILVRPRPAVWLWSRVVGDAVDLGLLGAILTRHRRARTLFAVANVVAVAVPDYYESRFLGRKRGPVRGQMTVRKAVTINRPRPEVEQELTRATELRRKLDENGARLRFAEAPGGRGTEVVAEFEHDPPAGDLGAAVEKLTGRDLATQLADDLRRFKQLVEAGEVTRSDATPHGHSLADHLRQRAAQPLDRAREEVAR
jgi:hypothetical protein